MPFQIVRDDITRVKADAIVNTANPRPVIGWGTDTAVYNAADKDLLLAEREKIGSIAPGFPAERKIHYPYCRTGVGRRQPWGSRDAPCLL